MFYPPYQYINTALHLQNLMEALFSRKTWNTFHDIYPDLKTEDSRFVFRKPVSLLPSDY